MRATALFLTLACAGCCLGSSRSPSTDLASPLPSSPELALDVEDPFIYARTERSPAAPPARFAAPWPVDVGGPVHDWPDDAPPQEQAIRRLCAGDPAAMRAWTDAARRTAASTPHEAALARLADHVEYCSSPRFCANGRDALDAASGIDRDLALLAMATCGDDRDAAVLDVDAAPPAARFRWLGARRYRDGALPAASAGHVAALRTLLDLVVLGDVRSEMRARQAVMLVRAMRGGDEALRASIGGLAPNARSLVTEALERPGGGAADEGPEPDAMGPDERAECAREGGWEGQACLLELARLDRARAVEVARALGDSDEALRSTVEALTRFPEAGGLEARLRELGLVADCATNGDVLDAPEVLVACQRGTHFDPETGTYPVGHDALLAELALLAPGALDDVVWEEIPPGAAHAGLIADYAVEDGELVENEASEGPYALRAYSRGERFEIPAQQLDDWYDLEAVIALLNAVARSRESDVRWLVVEPTGGNDATVVAGPEGGLRAAIDEHLIEPVGAGASATARDAEADLIRELFERGEF